MFTLVTGCQKQSETESLADNSSAQGKAPVTNGSLSSGLKMGQLSNDVWLKAVHSATARFHSTTQAIKAGYEPDDHCVSVPGLGGMGYHWVNFSLVDAVFDPLKPEVMLYETGPGGNPRLIAVEYIVIKAGQDWPMFGDHAFDDGGTPVPAPHWSLHVWVHKENPSGTFVPFNPNVSCP
mgnify:CR=1 FL=1